MIIRDYKPTVGIEVHCEMKTKAKMFSDSSNSYGSVANSNINFIDLGYPGVLPKLNRGAVRLALRAALVLNCTINKEMVFDRKNYFYPDLPKGYQITQARTPIGVNGYVDIEVDGKPKRIFIHDIHIEEDTAKSTHFNDTSLLDFNRAGVPLIEIVTEACMNSDKEAMAYVEKLKELLLYADVSDCKMEEGSMRCDVSISVSKTDELGTRAEIKNVSSVSNIGLAVISEANHQIDVIEAGGVLSEETKRYDEKTGKTVTMRVKETGNDYRYYPEPDIPTVVLTDEEIEMVKNSIPMLPDERRSLYKEAGLSDINSVKLIQNRSLSDFLLTVDKNINLVIASNLLLGDIAGYLNKNFVDIKNTKLDSVKFNELVNLVDKGELNSRNVKDMLNDLFETDLSFAELKDKYGIVKMSDDVVIDIINKVIENNPDSVKDFKEGKDRAVKFLMGQVMKESKGSCNPALANKLLVEILNKQ